MATFMHWGCPSREAPQLTIFRSLPLTYACCYAGPFNSAAVVLCCVARVWGVDAALPLILTAAALAAAALSPLLQPLPPLPPLRPPPLSPSLTAVPRDPASAEQPLTNKLNRQLSSPQPPSPSPATPAVGSSRLRAESVQALARASLDGLVRKSAEVEGTQVADVVQRKLRFPHQQSVEGLTKWRVSQQVRQLVNAWYSEICLRELLRRMETSVNMSTPRLVSAGQC
jgi:hypothetical protein